MKCATCGIDKEEYSGRFRINIRSCEKCYMKEYNRKKRSPESYEKTRMRTKNIRYFKYHTDPEFRQKAIENAERLAKAMEALAAVQAQKLTFEIADKK